MSPIILERTVDLESLEGTFISEVFKERKWKKLLNSMGNVYEDVIQEFYANAFMEGDHINCWLKGREFLISRELIQEILKVRPTTPHTSLQYDERREKLKLLVGILGGKINKKALHTITFTPEMWTLAYIMIFNLYPMRNLMNLSAPRSLFLFDICSHIYHLFTKSITKRNSMLTLPFPNLVMSLITRTRVKIPSGLQVMQREDPISVQTMTRSKAHIPWPSVGVSQIPRDEGGDTEEEIEHFTLVLEDTAQPSS